MDDNRDPFRQLRQLMTETGRSPSPVLLGQVLSTAPLRIRADGMDLDPEDLLVASRLLPGRRETLTGLSCGLTADLPLATLKGSGPGGAVSVTRPAATLQGRTASSASCVREDVLHVGDTVLLLRSGDGQLYYVLERMVSPDGAVSAD